MRTLANVWVEGVPPGVLQPLLTPAAWCYGVGARVKPALVRAGLWTPKTVRGAPVIAVGNITMGGAGKTPTVAWLAEHLRERGVSSAIVTRGYPGFGKISRRARRSVRVVCDGAGPVMGPEEAGDEPYLLATLLPETPLVIAGGKRYLAAKLAAEAFTPDVILLDDGYQHIQLARALTILVIDASRNLAHERIAPAGRLREPLSAARRADMVILNKVDAAPDDALADTMGLLDRYCPSAPRSRGRYTLRPLRAFGDRPGAGPAPGKLFAFAGIENPHYFRHLLAERHSLAGELWFPDHYAYDRQDMRAIAAAAREEGAEALVTTAKDAARLMRPGGWDATEAALPLYIADIKLSLEHGDEIVAAVMNACTGTH